MLMPKQVPFSHATQTILRERLGPNTPAGKAVSLVVRVIEAENREAAGTALFALLNIISAPVKIPERRLATIYAQLQALSYRADAVLCLDWMAQQVSSAAPQRKTKGQR